MSNDSSASHDRILVHKMPAAENALSASTDAGAWNTLQIIVYKLQSASSHAAWFKDGHLSLTASTAYSAELF